MYTEVNNVNSPPPAEMKGKKVGFLSFREYEAIMIGKNGGKSIFPHENLSDSHPYNQFLQLVENLEKGSIDGFALDRFTLVYAYWVSSYAEKGNFDWKWKTLGYTDTMIKDSKDRIKYFRKLVTVQLPPITSQVYTYGILVKNREDYLFYKAAAEDLGQTIGREWEQWYQETIKTEPRLLYSVTDELFSFTGSYFKGTVIAIGVIVVLICIFGIVYELSRREKQNHFPLRIMQRD